MKLSADTLIREYRCAQCYGPLVEACDAGEWRVVCPKRCEPGGFVTAAFVTRRLAESAAELEEVARNYPQLDKRPKQTPEQKRANRAALWGDPPDTGAKE